MRVGRRRSECHGAMRVGTRTPGCEYPLGWPWAEGDEDPGEEQ